MSTGKKRSKPQSLPAIANAFVGKNQVPTEQEVATALGVTKPVWDHLIASMQSEDLNVRDSEWKCPCAKYGWSLRLKRAGRNIIYLSPERGGFRVAFVLGKKAVDNALTSDLPQAIKQLIKDAPVYPEGTGLRIEVRSEKDLPAIVKLGRIKLEN